MAVDEYRFQVHLNTDRLLYLTIFNVAVLSAGTGLLKIEGSWISNLLVSAIFIAGLSTSLLAVRAVKKFQQYYRRTIIRKTIYEELLGLNQLHELPNGIYASLAIGTTESQADIQQTLSDTESWVRRPVERGSIVWSFRVTLTILAILNLLGAIAAAVFAFEKPVELHL